MKKILVVSDTHKNLKLLSEVLKNNIKDVDIIIHLGDYYEDIIGVENLLKNKIFYRVPGIFHPGYINGSLDIVKKIKVENITLVFAHRLEDLIKYAGFGDINLYGHTHKPDIFIRYDKMLVNPGHLKSNTDRGSTASYAIITIDKSPKVVIKDIFGNIIKENLLNR